MFCAKNSPVPDDTPDFGSRRPTIVFTRRSGPVGGAGSGDSDDGGVATGALLAVDGDAGLDDTTRGAGLDGVADSTAAELASPGGNGAAEV